jgi:hypothetical protein
VLGCVDLVPPHVILNVTPSLVGLGDFPMDSEHQKLKNDIELVRGAIVNPFYWLTIGFGLLMILPKFSKFPDYGVTYWHVFGVIIFGCVAGFAGHSWVSRRSDRRMKQCYPEMFSTDQNTKKSTNA